MSAVFDPILAATRRGIFGTGLIGLAPQFDKSVGTLTIPLKNTQHCESSYKFHTALGGVFEEPMYLRFLWLISDGMKVFVLLLAYGGMTDKDMQIGRRP